LTFDVALVAALDGLNRSLLEFDVRIADLLLTCRESLAIESLPAAGAVR
jgi:hypothetical protein